MDLVTMPVVFNVTLEARQGTGPAVEASTRAICPLCHVILAQHTIQAIAGRIGARRLRELARDAGLACTRVDVACCVEKGSSRAVDTYTRTLYPRELASFAKKTSRDVVVGSVFGEFARHAIYAMS